MDLERGIVRALFYDYPIDALMQQLERLGDMQHDDFLDVMPQLLQWAKQEYTFTEANLLRIQTGGEWTNDRQTSRATIYHVFDILSDVTEQLLTTENDSPLVRFGQLFRWKETALYVGEDMLVTSYMANKDVSRGMQLRKLFLWNDILKHNNHILNEELDRGLTDLHAHYNATADIFSLNWINMMNDSSLYHQFDEKIHRSMELELMSPKVEIPSNVIQHCIAAIYLRFVFFRLLLNPQQQKNSDVDFNYHEKVSRILKDVDFAKDIRKLLQASIDSAKDSSLHTSNNKPWDYCLLPSEQLDDILFTKTPSVKDIHRNSNLIYQGERQLLYTFFHGYYEDNPICIENAPYFYLYILLKNKIRREFIQINQLKGFENFQTYQGRKSILLTKSPIRPFYPYCVLYTSANNLEKDIIELRVAPTSLPKNNEKFNIPVFSDSRTDSTPLFNKKPKIVVHFIKKSKYDFNMPTSFYEVGKLKDGTRNEEYRDEILNHMGRLLPQIKSKGIVGIDAASSEIFCRPETFAHVFRFAHISGIDGRTYHVGEDFLDLPDGLRAIDEAILFLQLDEKCRLGHAMALGINAKQYFERRHYTTIITRQYLLDDCVWIYMRSKELNIFLNPTYEVKLLEKASQLFHEIGYSGEWNVQCYWHSMLLRGNDISSKANDHTYPSWAETAILNDDRVKPAQQDIQAEHLYKDYFEDPQIRSNGLKLVKYKWLPEIVDIVSQLQDKLRLLVSRKRISIECCPTSNLKIGFIDRYEQHPLLTRFYPIDADASYPLIKCSINTDDRGVFYTSIYEEYSLIALALYKMKDEKTGEPKYNEREILRYIGEIRKNAQLMTFRNYTDNK